jgi:NAD(P)-dependent dehydrogenase (short-subunit alcohol dehydrogenase family)
MLLEGKTAVIHGGGGAIGGAVAREFAREGARIFLAGRSLPKLERVARLIVDEGGTVDYDEVDALDEFSVERHADQVADAAGGIDISLNAVGIAHIQGTPFAKLSFAEYSRPVEAYSRTNFITARAAARRMAVRRSGAILMMSPPGSRLSGVGYVGIGVASAAVEALSRALAGELEPQGIRVACLRLDAIPEANDVTHAGRVFAGLAASADASVGGMLGERARSATLPRRLPTLAEVGSFAAMVASAG